MVSFGYLFHDSKRTPITDAYTVKGARGSGKFSVVKEAVENATNKPCALKIMKKSVVQEHNLLKEVEILRHLNHPNIVNFIDIYETDVDLILVLELVTGGELFDKIVERVSYTEEDAAKLVQQITSILYYLHTKNIVHCDLKPENLLYSDMSSDATIKLCDFGLSQVQVNNLPLTAILGTPTYMAPEIRACVGYGKPVDMWSLGVIVYILLCGYPPFDETTCLLEFPSPEWDYISHSAKDLISSLLLVDTLKRFTVQQVMSHSWVSGAAAGKQSIAGALKTMRVFNTARKSGTPFRGPTARASVFNLFPDTEDKTRTPEELEQYPAADSPAFFTIHNPLATLELYSPSSQSPTLNIDGELARGGSPLDSPTSPEKSKDWGGRRTPTNNMGREPSNSQRWEGADSKELLARELGLILQANPQFLRSLSEVSGGSGSSKGSLSNSGPQQSTSTQQSVSLEDLMNSLTAGIDNNELVRPLSGHFNRLAHLEDHVKDLQSALDAERNNRITVEDALDAECNARITVEQALDAERFSCKSAEETHARISTQITHAQDEARRLEAYASVHQDQELVDMARSLVNYMDTIIVNINKGLKPAPPRSDSNDWSTMKDTIEGLKEENATLDKLYRQTKAELESQKEAAAGGGGGGNQDSLRKKNKQLEKELEMLHKEYETLLHTKGGSEDPSTDESDDFFEDRRGKRKNKSGFLKRIIG